MNISLTQEEYKTLLEVLDLTDWVLHAYKTDLPPETQKYRDLEQKVFSYAERFKAGNLVAYDETFQQYFPTKEFEDHTLAMDLVEDFEDETFWAQLIERLTERDLTRQVGEGKLLEMSPEERQKKELPLYGMYSAEFEINGLDNITID